MTEELAYLLDEHAPDDVTIHHDVEGPTTWGVEFADELHFRWSAIQAAFKLGELSTDEDYDGDPESLKVALQRLTARPFGLSLIVY